MPAIGLLLALSLNATVFVPPNTLEWNDEICRYRGTFDASKTSPDVLQNTVNLVLQGPAFFEDAAAKEREVHPDFALVKDRYRDFARYTQAISQQRLAWLHSENPAELRKPVLGRPSRPLCDKFVELLTENDLKQKLDRFLRIYPEVCRLQGGMRKDCEHTARVHAQTWTSIRNANLSLVGTDWNNCMIHYDEVHQLPQFELASIFQSIEPSDCTD